MGGGVVVGAGPGAVPPVWVGAGALPLPPPATAGRTLEAPPLLGAATTGRALMPSSLLLLHMGSQSAIATKAPHPTVMIRVLFMSCFLSYANAAITQSNVMPLMESVSRAKRVDG